MATQGMFGNQYQQAVDDEAALRKQSNNSGGLTGWAAITQAMGQMGGELGYQGGQALGGQTPAQVEQANFQAVMDSVPDFDPTKPSSLNEMAAAYWQGGFYDEGMAMMTQSQQIQSNLAQRDLWRSQAFENRQADPTKDTRPTNKKDYDSLISTGDFMVDGADGVMREGTYLEYLDRNQSELTTDEKHYRRLSEADTYDLSFQEFLDNKASGGRTASQKEYAQEKAEGYEGDFGSWLDMDANRKLGKSESFASFTASTAEADVIDAMLDENYDFGALDFDLWGLGDKANSMSATDGVEVLRQKVYNIYKNSNKIFGRVLTFDEIIAKYPNPADLMAVKIGSGNSTTGDKEEVAKKKINKPK